MINKCNWRREGKGKGQREACKTAFEMDRRKGVEKNGREREREGRLLPQTAAKVTC